MILHYLCTDQFRCRSLEGIKGYIQYEMLVWLYLITVNNISELLPFLSPLSMLITSGKQYN